MSGVRFLFIFFRSKEAELKMTFSLIVFSTLFGIVEVVTGAGVFDSSNYKALGDPDLGNYSFYAAKCTGESRLKFCVVCLILIFNFNTLRK